MKIRSWILITGWEEDSEIYEFDSSNWDVSEEELSICINEQIYGDNLK